MGRRPGTRHGDLSAVREVRSTAGSRLPCGLPHVVGALDGTRHFYPRCDAELAEGVAQVRFNRLRAQEELGRDLRIGLAVDDESCDLELALGERVDAGRVSLAWLGAPVDRASELPELPFGLQSVTVRAEGLERCGPARRAMTRRPCGRCCVGASRRSSG